MNAKSAEHFVYDWLIVGGGIHGVTIATFLLQLTDVQHDSLLIVDPNKELLSNWTERAASVGMKTLRSALVHHIDVDPFSLRSFAGTGEGRAHGKLRGRYGHPDVGLFAAHCENVVEKNKLESIHLCDSVVGVRRGNREAWKEVVLQNRVIRSKNIVLALGNPQPLWPTWAREATTLGKTIVHAFELERGDTCFAGKNVAVIGGGLTAAQVALKLLDCGARAVKLFSRHPLRVSQFDSDPGWIGPKYRDGFVKMSCPISKREKICEARERGSMTPDTHRDLKRAIRLGYIKLEICKRPVTEASAGMCSREWDFSGSLDDYDCVVLATGFDSSVPGGQLVPGISSEFGLPLTPCGLPLLDESVMWGDGIFVSGTLAEMRIGPVARNIAGARSAAAEIVEAARAAGFKAYARCLFERTNKVFDASSKVPASSPA